MIVTIMGATGNTGKVTAERLLAAGVTVRALGRSAENLAPLASAGAQPVVADATSDAALTAAFRGSDVVYALVPPSYGAPDLLAYYERVNTAIARAVTESGVRRVVYLSSVGAELPSGTGPIVGLHRGEKRLGAIPGLDLLLLRPAYFYENHLGSIGLIKHQGLNGGATGPEVLVPTIAAGDIGEIAARRIAEARWSGTTVLELRGPRDLTMTEATRILGGKIGKPDLKYVQFPDEGVIGGLKGAGFSEDIARKFVEMSHAFNAGIVKTHQPRTPETTGRTTFETFADGWAKAYQGA